MPLSKVLQSIRSQIGEIIPTLDSFSDDNVQPGIADCELLQKQLCELQENLAVYKYSHQDIDFSPSFKIHAKISEKEVETPVAQTNNNTEPVTVIKPPEPQPVVVEAPPAPVNQQKAKPL